MCQVTIPPGRLFDGRVAATVDLAVKRVAGVDRAMERAVLETEERAAVLAEILHRHPDDGAQHEHRVDDGVAMAVRPGRTAR